MVEAAHWNVKHSALERECAELRKDAARTIPDDEDTRFILGMICIEVSPYAHLLRDAKVEGFADLPRKAEAEQAAVLRWLLNFYIQHGSKWREHASPAIKAAFAKVAAMTAKPTEARHE